MADPTVKLRVLLEAVGIKPTTEQIKKLSKSLQGTTTKSKELSQQMGQTYRNLRGGAQATGSANKDFARMSQGMGGLVAAYATVAANVFALSSAFLVLRRAADLSSMIKSAEDFSNRFGVSVVEITKRMQEASGGALDFAEALPTINKAVSAGIGIEQMERLTVAATKAAQTFGGTTTEALNRFISASQRGRVEIIQTLGVVIKTEQAYKDYAATIGKTALELSAFDRQQAILNATIAESEKVFDGIAIDPNPFQQLLVTVTDLKNEIATFVTDGVTPMISAFNQSKSAATALIAVIATSVGKRIFPELASGIAKLSAAGLASTKAARAASAGLAARALKLENELAKTSTDISLKAIKKRDAAFKKSLADRLTAKSVFNKKIIDENNKVNTAILTSQRALLAKEINLRESGTVKGRQKLFADTSTVDLKRQATNLNQIGLNADKANISIKNMGESAKQTSTIIQKGMLQASTAVSNFRVAVVTAQSALKTGFAQGFLIAEGKVIKSIRGMNVAWLVFIRDIAAGTVKSGTNLSNFAKAFGRTAGVVAGGISKLVSVAFSLTLVISLASLAWELFGKKLFGVTDEQETLSAALEDLSGSLEDITNRTNAYIVSTTEAAKTAGQFVKSLEFLRGTLDSTITSFNDFNTAFVEAFSGKNIEQTIAGFSSIREDAFLLANTLSEMQSRRRDLNDLAATGVGLTRSQFNELELLNSQIKLNASVLGEFNKENTQTLETMRQLADNVGPDIVRNFVSLNKLFSSQGIVGPQIELIDALRTNLKGLDGDSQKFIQALSVGDTKGFIKALSDLKDIESIGAVFTSLSDVITKFSGDLFASVQQQIAAGKGFQDLDNRINTFVQGIDKLKAASVPNKEIVNFLIDIDRQLSVLEDTSLTLGNIANVEGSLINAKDVENVTALLGLGSDATLAEAIEVTTRQLNIFKGLVIDNTLATNELKIASLQLKTLKEEELTTDERKLAIIKETNILNLKRASNELRITSNKIKLLQEELAILDRGKKADSERASEIERTLRVLEAEKRAREGSIAVLRQNKDEQRQITKIILERLNIIDSINDTLLQNDRLSLSISETNAEHLELSLSIFKREQQNLKLEKAKLEQQKSRLQFEDKTNEQKILETQQLEAQLALIETQNRELERRRLLLFAQQQESAGTTIFDEQGLEIAAAFFLREIRDGVRGLKTTFEILGRGFVSIINNTFDTMVDNLLEGGKDFGRTVVETLKEGMREVFGEALKTRIKEALAGLFTLGSKGDPAIPTNTLATNVNSAHVAANTAVNQTQVVPAMGLLTGAVTSLAGVMGAPTGTTAGAGASSALSFLGGLVSPLVTGANGGIMKGGSTPLPSFASGGVVTGPQLALIGEGKNNEAVVPLPNDREIPVKLEGGSGDSVNIEQNFDFRGADANTITQLRNQARVIEERTFARVFTEINKGGKFAKMTGRR